MSKVLYEKRDEIAYITLNRPEKLNAIDLETEELLHEAWTRFATTRRRDLRSCPAAASARSAPAQI